MDYIKKENVKTYYRLGSIRHSFFSIFVVLFIVLSTITHSIIRAAEEKVSEFDLINTEEQYLSEIKDKNQIVHKFFKLQTYSPISMAQIIEPMLSRNGFLSVDEDTRTLFVVETFKKLETIEKIIKIYDKAYDHTITSVFKLNIISSNKAADIISKIIELEFIQLHPDNIVASLSEKNWIIARAVNSKDLVLIGKLLSILDQPVSETSLDQGGFTSSVYQIKHANPQRLEELFKFIFKDNSGIQINVEEFKQSLIVFAHKSTHEKMTKFLEILDTPNKEIPTDISSRVTKAKSEFDRRNDPMVALNLLEVNLNRLGKILSEWTGKEIIFTDDTKNVRISIYAPGRIPRSKALNLIDIALEAKGFIAIHCEEAIYIEPKSKIDKTQVKNGKTNQE